MALGAGARGTARKGVGRAAGTRGARCTQAWARPRRVAGQWAMHLVHSAYF